MNLSSRVLCMALGLSQLALTGDASAEEKPATAAPAQPAASAATPAGADGQQPPGWTVQCANSGKGLECKAQQTIVMAKTRQLLLGVSVTRPADDKDGAMLLQLPHGLFNPAGVTLAIDEAKPEPLVIQTCDVKGCYAGAPLAADKVAALGKGTRLNVVFQDLKKQQITVPVPLKGFEEAYKKLGR